MSRRKAREVAVKCIYQYSFGSQTEIEKMVTYNAVEEELEQEQANYVLDIVNGMITHLQEIDNLILSHLKNWTIERISKIDLAILRVAIYEILFEEGIPPKVSANEAVEIAKEYGNEESPKFINGIIANVMPK